MSFQVTRTRQYKLAAYGLTSAAPGETQDDTQSAPTFPTYPGKWGELCWAAVTQRVT